MKKLKQKQFKKKNRRRKKSSSSKKATNNKRHTNIKTQIINLEDFGRPLKPAYTVFFVVFKKKC